MERGPSRLGSSVQPTGTMAAMFEKVPEPEKEIEVRFEKSPEKKPELEKRCEFAIPGTDGQDNYVLCCKQGECNEKGIFRPVSPADREGSGYNQTYNRVLPRCKVNGIIRYSGAK